MKGWGYPLPYGLLDAPYPPPGIFLPALLPPSCDNNWPGRPLAGRVATLPRCFSKKTRQAPQAARMAFAETFPL